MLDHGTGQGEITRSEARGSFRRMLVRTPETDESSEQNDLLAHAHVDGGPSASELGAMVDLDRFREAQDRGRPGFAEVLRELRAGRKTGHWIWYVFPQLRGLGQSPMAVRYGLDGIDEAAAYLGDPVLGQRLGLATEAVRAHVAPVVKPGARLEDVMGSDIDAKKLVSSLTLFGSLARAEHAAALAAFADDAETILRAAAAQGYERCAFTDAQLARRPRS
jgi:uncharacterized protein (DUF1810 family)